MKTTRTRVEAQLIKAYRWRQDRYASGVHGHGCFNEDNMAREISRLESQLEDLGGDPLDCLRQVRQPKAPFDDPFGELSRNA